MANTKIPVELSSTPGIVDNSNATAITIDSSENIFLSNTTSLIGVNTSDGSDNKSVMVNGGGAASSSRGAYVWLKGNEHSSNPGFLQLTSGSVSGAAITMITNGSERARITNDGLTFNGDTASANALDDYEEGTWSPTIIGSSGASGQSYTLQNGRYRKIGKFVTLGFDVQLSAKGTLSGPYVLLGGHGFTFEGNNLGGVATVAYAANISNQTDPIFAYINAGNIYLMLGGTTSYITTAGGYINDNSRILGCVTGLIS